MSLRDRVREWLDLDRGALAVSMLRDAEERHYRDLLMLCERIEKALVVDIPQRKLKPKPRVQTFEDMEQEALQELEKENHGISGE